ncbi:hypothetical protein WJX77_006213 [Trebouxia sp. C0004]
MRRLVDQSTNKPYGISATVTDSAGDKHDVAGVIGKSKDTLDIEGSLLEKAILTNISGNINCLAGGLSPNISEWAICNLEASCGVTACLSTSPVWKGWMSMGLNSAGTIDVRGQAYPLLVRCR